jgi:uncharacterized protein (DUF1015 family)
LWKIDDATLQKKLVGMLKGKELFIADGHHRYEVAWAYKESRLNGQPNADRSEAWNFVMTYICPMEEKGLLMLPTHRLVKSRRSFDEWEKHLRAFFDIKPVKDPAAIVKALSGAHSGRVLGWQTSRGSFLLSLKKDVAIDRCLSQRPDALKELDVVLLHDLALNDPAQEIIYSRDLAEIKSKIQSDPAWVCFYLASPGVESLARVSIAGEVMPPKTTYFYPKVPTGFTMLALDQKIK